MSDQTIFDKEVTPQETSQEQQASTSAPNIDSLFADQLAKIRNAEGQQKYKTPTDALNALYESQNYIPQLQNQLKEAQAQVEAYKQKAERVSALEETIAKITSEAGQKQSESISQPALTEEMLAKLIDQRLTQTQQESQYKANTQKVVSALKDKFGETAETEFYRKGAELGLSAADLNALAAKSPESVLRLVGISGQKQEFFSPSKPGLNTEGFKPNTATFIKRNSEALPIGATHAQLRVYQDNAAKMAEELSALGYTTDDLSDPKVFARFFK